MLAVKALTLRACAAVAQGRRELEAFFSRWYGPERLTIAVVGDVTATQARAPLAARCHSTLIGRLALVLPHVSLVSSSLRHMYGTSAACCPTIAQRM